MPEALQRSLLALVGHHERLSVGSVRNRRNRHFTLPPTISVTRYGFIKKPGVTTRYLLKSSGKNTTTLSAITPL